MLLQELQRKVKPGAAAAAAVWEQRANSSCIDVRYGLIQRAAICVFLGFTAAGCAGWFTPSRPDPAAEMPALEKNIYTLVAAERAKIDTKARALSLDPELTDVARKRSAEMARTNSFATGDDPHLSATMLMNQDANFQGLVGENVAAQHYLPDQGVDPAVFAKRFVDGWLASKPHRDNLAFTDYDRTGIGAAVNGDTVFVAQLFTTDLGLGAKQGNEEQKVQTLGSAQEGKADAQEPPLRGAIVPSNPPGTPENAPQR
jgi:uncharacterized protein YkwD